MFGQIQPLQQRRLNVSSKDIKLVLILDNQESMFTNESLSGNKSYPSEHKQATILNKSHPFIN
jgi:hypothetical protein